MVISSREAMPERPLCSSSHQSLCPLLTSHCFWQLYLCYGFSFTVSCLPFLYPLPPSFSVVSSLPLHRLHPMTFCKHFIREPLVFSKTWRQTDRAAVNRAGGWGDRGSRSVEGFAPTTMWLKFLQHRFKYWIGWLWRVGDSCEAQDARTLRTLWAHTHTHAQTGTRTHTQIHTFLHISWTDCRRATPWARLFELLQQKNALWRNEHSNKMLTIAKEVRKVRDSQPGPHWSSNQFHIFLFLVKTV